MGALYKGVIISGLLAAIAFYPITGMMEMSMGLYWSAIIGLVLTAFMVMVTEFYTSTEYSPVQKIAEASTTGHATNIIAGLGVSMKATALPVLAVCLSIWGSFMLAGGSENTEQGLYGIAIAATSMLSLTGMIVALDAFGPITDNAGGIAEMSGMGKKVRDITDSLDELGNTSAAIGKGFAIGAAALAALAIISAFSAVVTVNNPEFSLSLSDPIVLVGMFIGACIPFLVSSITMTAVGDAAFEMINEIRRQFKEIPGIMEGKEWVWNHGALVESELIEAKERINSKSIFYLYAK